MFYEKEVDKALRFGDVLRGFVLAASDIEEPDSRKSFAIDVDLPSYCVVLSPCCSIGHKKISLTPLIRVRHSFFDNPYFEEDLTRINRKMEPQQSVAPIVWDQFSPEEKQKRLEEGLNYAFLGLFIYEKHDLFPEYCLGGRKGNTVTNYYMIDFTDIQKVNCGKIVTPENAPLDTKCLQLSVDARSELRDKIAYYYARVPKEDKILED